MVLQLPNQLFKRLLVLCKALNAFPQLVNCHLVFLVTLLESLIVAACTTTLLLRKLSNVSQDMNFGNQSSAHTLMLAPLLQG